MSRNHALLPLLLLAIPPCRGQIASFKSADVAMTNLDTRALTVSKGSAPATIQFTADPSAQGGDLFQIVAPDSTIGVSLITPGGVEITAANAASQGYDYEAVTTGVTTSAYLSGPLGTPGTQTLIVLPAGCPPGSYQVKIDPSHASASATVVAMYYSTSSVGAGIVTDAPFYRTGDTVVLTGVVRDGSQAVPGASASVRVGMPLVAGATTSTIKLQDSGNGLYTGTSVASTPGTYTAALRVTGTSASGIAFSRTVTTTFTVVASLARFAGFSDSAVDTNGDGVFEEVAVAVGLKVGTPGHYRLSGTLQASNGQQIMSSAAVSLTTATASTSLIFPASDILRLGVNGPYEMVNVLLLYEDDPEVPISDIMNDAGKTSPYKLSSFVASGGTGACSYTLAAGNPNPPSFTSAGGSGTATVTAATGCSWTATSSAPSWLATTSTGSGNGTVNYTVAANTATGATSRTGTIIVGAATLTVTQAAGACSYTLAAGNPNLPSFTSAGGSGTATVTAATGCSWTATSSAPGWLATTSTGSGNGTVNYMVAANTATGATSRTGTIIVGGATLTVTQAAGACSYTLAAGNPNPPSFTSAGGSGTATVTAATGCSWTATSSAPGWLATTSTGSGNGTVNYTVAANTATGATSRTGTITVGAATLTVTQAGGSGGGSTSITINNPGFETLPANPQWSDCSGYSGAGCRDTVDGKIPGWTSSGAGPIGLLQPGPNNVFTLPLPAAEGQMVAQINSGAISQTLSATLQVSTVYTLQVDVGQRLDKLYPSPPPAAQLFAGTTLIASATGALPPLGGWTTWTGSYTSSASDPLAGQALKIVLGATTPQGDFDNVRLTAALAGSYTCTNTTPPVVASIDSASGYGGYPYFASGSWLEIKGTNLADPADPRLKAATNPGQWTSGDFHGSNAPTVLDGISVSINGKPAYIWYLSATQLNVQAPEDTATGNVAITVTNCNATSPAFTFARRALAPGFLAPSNYTAGGTGYMVATFASDGAYVLNTSTGASFGLNSRPAKPGDMIVAYGIGFGDVTPSILPGVIVGQSNALVNPITLFFGSTQATLSYSGLAGSFVGLYEFYITVPSTLANGDYQIKVTQNGTAVPQTMYLTVHN